MVKDLVDRIGLLSCGIIGMLTIIIFGIWVHSICTSNITPKKRVNHGLYYVTQTTIIIYSLHVVLSLASGIIYYILLKQNITSLGYLIFSYAVYGMYIIAVYVMFGSFILRLDYAFRNTYYEYNRKTIIILWFIYGLTIILLPLSTVLYVLGLSKAVVIVGSIAAFVFAFFILILFRMFISKLKQIANDKSQQRTQYIRELIVKLNIIVMFTVSSTCISFLSSSIAGGYSDSYPDIMSYVTHIILAADSCMLYIYICPYINLKYSNIQVQTRFCYI